MYEGCEGATTKYKRAQKKKLSKKIPEDWVYISWMLEVTSTTVYYYGFSGMGVELARGQRRPGLHYFVM